MDFIAKLKETLISVVPIVVVVLILNFTIAPIGEALVPFLIGAVLLVLGLSLFLTGTDIGMVPIGQKLGSVLTQKRNLPFMLAIGFVIGFGVTFAEPDVTVLAAKVHSLNPSVNESFLVLMIAIGLGVFVDIGLLRVVKKISLRKILIVFYLIVFVVLGFARQTMASIAFDASGATTGPLAVPFLLALGLGVSLASKDGQNDSFGLTGIASIGPIIAVGLYACLSKNGAQGSVAFDSVFEKLSIGTVLKEMTVKTARGFGPLALIILILQFTLLHFPKIRFRKICFGVIYSFVGIVVFLSGVEFGFTNVGTILGREIANGPYRYLTILVGFVFGAIVVCAEPAVWVLTKQVEEVTVGRIKRSLVMIFLCIGVSLAVGLSIVRIMLGINYLWFIYVGVGLSLILTFFSPSLFTGLAFDSGGVASGPMSTTFLLSFAIGVSGSAEMGFGLVGLIAISPLLSIQILGVIFALKEKKDKGV